MFESIRNAFAIPNIRRRLGFTFLMIIVIRLGALIPIPGVDSNVFSELFSNAGGALNFFDAITGGSMERMSVFALSITPYITASIIMQLLTIAFPKLEEIQRDGETGRKKITKVTRYLTIGLSVAESLALAIGFGRSGYLESFTAPYVLTIVACMTAGSAILMWIGERITESGIGNGISIVLIINIISRIPSDFATLNAQFVEGQTVARGVLAWVIIAAIIVGVVILVVLLQGAERRIPVQYSRRMAAGGGARLGGSQTTYIPMKVNTSGVIPVIFAQSIMQTPVVIAAMLGQSQGTGIGYEILKCLNQSNWFNPSNWIYTIGAAVYVLLVIAFAYFYTAITFNPLEIAENMKKSGGSIPGIRPGKPTSDYIQFILKNIVFIGAVGLAIVAIIPIIFNGVFNANVSFGGTSIIIIVGVIIETMKQIESQMMVRNYKGFLS